MKHRKIYIMKKTILAAIAMTFAATAANAGSLGEWVTVTNIKGNQIEMATVFDDYGNAVGVAKYRPIHDNYRVEINGQPFWGSTLEEAAERAGVTLEEAPVATTGYTIADVIAANAAFAAGDMTSEEHYAILSSFAAAQ